jgi:hypothetical protein
MKKLHIIESETPGVTRSRVKVEIITRHFSTGPDNKGIDVEVGDFSELEIEKQKGYYKGQKILSIYRNGWKSDEYFIRHFM